MGRIADAPAGTALSTHHDDLRDTLSGASAEPLRTSNYEPAPSRGRHGSGRYRRDYLYPASYEILVHSEDPRLASSTCRWSASFGDVDTKSQPCRNPKRLSVGPGRRVNGEWIIATALRLSVDGGPEHIYEIRFRDTLVVALGDSYISGEGNPDVPSVITNEPLPVFERASWGAKLSEARREYQPASWWDEPCHRSLLSWPVLSSLAYAAKRPREAVTLVHLGCSGAVVRDILDHGETDLPGGGDEPRGQSQLAQLDHLLSAGPGARRPDRILLSVGGNDSGFVGVLATVILPPGGYWVPILGPVAVGAKAGAICPYRHSGQLERLCPFRISAETRLERRLPGLYRRLGRELRGRGWTHVSQFAYPNPISGEGRVPCDMRTVRDPEWRVEMGGFEALMGIMMRQVRGREYSWDFELQYSRETIQGEPLPDSGCDDNPESRDSEVCQALLVYSRLNRRVEENHPQWDRPIVNTHLNAIAEHGICRRDAEFERALPRVVRGQWLEGRAPNAYHPYHADNPRWFRLPNDSIVTQYGDPGHFHHGSFHPTLRAHLAYAEAALNEAFAD